MKDQHYSMKDPSKWTKEDWEMYRRDEATIEHVNEACIHTYTLQQITEIEQQLDYEETMKNTKKEDEYNRVMGICFRLIIDQLVIQTRNDDLFDLLFCVEDMTNKVIAGHIQATATDALKLLDLPQITTQQDSDLWGVNSALEKLTITKDLPF